MVKGTGALVCGITPHEPAEALPSLPALRVEIWHPEALFPSSHEGSSLARTSRGAHFQVRISFVRFSATGTSFFEARRCMCAGLTHTYTQVASVLFE